MGVLADLRSGAADLLIGARCVSCSRPGTTLCWECAPALSRRPHRSRPDPPPPGLDAVWAAAAYDGVARDALLAHKERSVLALSAPLGRALGRSVASCLADAERAGGAPLSHPLLVPVPSRRSVVRARGHDPVLRMARAAARSLRRVGLDAETAALLTVARSVRDQSELRGDERRDNLSGAMRARRVARARLDRPVVLVDDIVTTGATAAEGVRALVDADLRVVGVAVVAATRRRRGPP